MNKSMKGLLLLFASCLLIFSTYAQQADIEVKGTIKDDTGATLPGVNVMVKGTQNGTITGMDGTFRVTLKEKGTLVFSFIGMKSQEIAIDGNVSDLNVSMVADMEVLDDVVVVGYGTVRKSDLTGAVAKVKVEENVARQSTSVDQMLQGRVAGVQINSNSGNPGSGISVRIRGTSSLRGNNEPLYVVDGVIISSAGEDASLAGGGNETQSNQNGLNGINPRDIESVEVLKDASATAIYGSRGANGVVLITTKKGEEGKVRINAYATGSVSELSKKINVMEGVDYARYMNEVNLQKGNGASYHIDNGQVFPIENGEISTEAADLVNYQNDIYHLAQNFNAGVSFSGGTKKGSYYVSLGYNDQKGLVKNSKLQSGDLRLNLKQNLTDNLTLDTKISAFYSKGSFSQDGNLAGGSSSFIGQVIRFSPIIGADVEDQDELGVSNPYAWLSDFEDTSKENRLIGSMSLNYKLPLRGLSYKVQVGGNIRNKERGRFYGTGLRQGEDTNGLLSTSLLETNAYTINNLLNFNRTFSKKHRVNAVVGTTYDEKSKANNYYQVQDFSTFTFTGELPQYGQLVSTPMGIDLANEKMLSYLGRVNYTFDNRYTLTATFRADGSSKFKNENRWGYFPSFSVAWNAANESFISSTDIFDELKVRAGWGIIGNQAIQPYQTFANFGPTNYASIQNGINTAFVPTNIANDDLKWESTEQYNVGIDFGVVQNRVTGSVDVYQKNTKDLLQRIALPTSTGFASMFVNGGELRNEGIEFSLNVIAVDKGDFRFDIGGNIAFNRTMITSLDIPEAPVLIDGVEQMRSFYIGDKVSTGSFFKSPANIFIEGEAVGLFYGYETDGIYQSSDEIAVDGAQPGDVKIIDQNGDGEINLEDRTIIGDPNPDFTYGINLSASYKRLSLSALVNGVYGNDVINGSIMRWATADGTSNNILPAAYHEAWRPDAESNTYPRIGYTEQGATAITDRIVEDGSFIRLANLTIGYDLPVEKFMGRCNIYFTAQNLFTITGYSGYDPVITSFMNNGNIMGVDWNGYPNARTFLVGLNVNF